MFGLEVESVRLLLVVKAITDETVCDYQECVAVLDVST